MSIFMSHAKYYDEVYKDKDYEREAREAYEWAGRPKRILDLGCGTGKHISFLADNAIITGVDQSQEMLDRAFKHPNITYINEDITKYKGGEVDAAFCLFNVVGYVGCNGLLDILLNTRVKSGGYFIFDCWDYCSVFPNESSPRVAKFEGFSRVSSVRFKASVDIVIIEGGKRVTETHDITPYYHSDILEACSGLYRIEEDKQTDSWTRKYKLRRY